MTTALNEQLNEIVQLNQSDPAQVLADALRQGMKHVYLDAILSAYVRGRISRTEAIQKAGAEAVLRADEEKQAVLEDVKWGLSSPAA